MSEHFYGTLLHLACCKGNIQLVQECLEQGLDINARDLLGRTPFFYSSSSTAIVKLFVENGYDTNAYDIDDKYGFTPLIRTLYHKSSEHEIINETLNNMEVDVNKKSLHGHSPLMFALVKNISIESLNKLLQKGAEATCFDNNGNSVLSYAMRYFSSLNAHFLIKYGAKVDEFQGEGKPPLIWAVIYENSEAVNYLLSKNANVNLCDGDGNTALAYAAFYGNLDIAEILFENGAKVNLYNDDKKMGKTPLAWAIIGGKTDMMDLLIKNKAGSFEDSFGNTLLITAARYQTIYKFQLLINNVAIDAVSNDGKTVLIWAIIKENIKMIQILIENDASCCKSGKNTQKPLYYAVKSGNKKIAELLFKNGAKITFRSAFPLCMQMKNVEMIELFLANGAPIEGISLFKYISYKNYDLFELFVKYRANINEVAGNGQTLLDSAIKNNQFRFFNLLIQEGIDFKIIEASLETAIKNENCKMVNFLLEKDVSPNKAFQNGELPLKMAAKLFNFDIIRLLISFGATISDAKDELEEFASFDVDFEDYLKKEMLVSEQNNKSKDSKTAEEVEKKCIKCGTQSINAVYHDCGHKEMCFGCASEHLKQGSGKCSICLKTILSVRIF